MKRVRDLAIGEVGLIAWDNLKFSLNQEHWVQLDAELRAESGASDVHLVHIQRIEEVPRFYVQDLEALPPGSTRLVEEEPPGEGWARVRVGRPRPGSEVLAE